MNPGTDPATYSDDWAEAVTFAAALDAAAARAASAAADEAAAECQGRPSDC
jgi:hypothetical protein